MEEGSRLGSGEAVLVVDSDARSRDSAAEVLKWEGFSPLRADSVDLALAILANFIPDIIVVGHKKPPDSLEPLLASSSRSGVPVVILADGASAAEKAEAYCAGACGILDTPWSASDLLAEVGRLLHHRLQRKAA